MPYSWLFATTWLCSLLFVTTCHIICHAHALQFAICCRMPYSLLFVAACRTVCYLLLHAVQFASSCSVPYSLLSVAARRTVLTQSNFEEPQKWLSLSHNFAFRNLVLLLNHVYSCSWRTITVDYNNNQWYKLLICLYSSVIFLSKTFLYF